MCSRISLPFFCIILFSTFVQRSPDGSSLYAASFEAGDDSENGDTFAVARMVMSPEKTEELASLVAATRREFRGSSGLTKLLVNYCDDHGEAGEMHSSPPVMSAAQQWQEAAEWHEVASKRIKRGSQILINTA